MKENTEDKDWALIARHLGKELNESEEAQFVQWKNASEQNRSEAAQAEKVWQFTGEEDGSVSFDANRGWDTLHRRIRKNASGRTRTLTGTLLKIAAAVLIVAGIGVAIRYALHAHNYTTVTAANQKMLQPVILPDGTRVYLNAGSTLTYPRHFAQTREVNLSGEAFFNVTHNEKSPFVIHAAQARIKVLGTSFNVAAYRQTDSVQVVVETGTVELAPDQAGDKIRLTRGNAGVYYASSKRLVKSESSDANTFAWKTNRLTFRNADLNYVVRILEKQFSQKIQFNGEKLKNYRLNADYIDLDLESIFQALKTSHCLSVKKSGNAYILSGPGC